MISNKTAYQLTVILPIALFFVAMVKQCPAAMIIAAVFCLFFGVAAVSRRDGTLAAFGITTGFIGGIFGFALIFDGSIDWGGVWAMFGMMYIPGLILGGAIFNEQH